MRSRVLSSTVLPRQENDSKSKIKRDLAIIRDYKKDIPVRQIIEKYNIASNTITSIIIRNKIPMKSELHVTVNKKILNVLTKDKLLSTRDIAKKSHVAYPTVKSNMQLIKEAKRVKCPCGAGFLYSLK